MVSGQTPGSTASYSCNEGFALFGDSMRTCLDSEEWSGSEPTCESEALTHMLLYPHNALVGVTLEKQ